MEGKLQLKDEKSRGFSASGTSAFSISMDLLHHKQDRKEISKYAYLLVEYIIAIDIYGCVFCKDKESVLVRATNPYSRHPSSTIYFQLIEPI